MKCLFPLMISLLVLAGCSVNEAKAPKSPKPDLVPAETADPKGNQPSDQTSSKDKQNSSGSRASDTLSDPAQTFNIESYFPPENKIYTFNGNGNEYAGYKEVFYQKTGNYLPSIVENGGTRILQVYELTADGIYLVYKQPEFYEETIPAIDAIKNQFSPVPLLKQPLKEGTSFAGWKIIDHDAKAALPIGKIKNIIITEHINDNQTINRSYWAPGYGKVKEVFLFTNEESGSNSVRSELAKIE